MILSGPGRQPNECVASAPPRASRPTRRTSAWHPRLRGRAGRRAASARELPARRGGRGRGPVALRRLQVLAIFDKPDPLEGPYFEETLYVTPSRLPAAVLAEVARITAQGCPSATVTWASCSPAGSPGAFAFS